MQCGCVLSCQVILLYNLIILLCHHLVQYNVIIVQTVAESFIEIYPDTWGYIIILRCYNITCRCLLDHVSAVQTHQAQVSSECFFAFFCDLCHMRLQEDTAHPHLVQRKHTSVSLYFVPGSSDPMRDVNTVCAYTWYNIILLTNDHDRHALIVKICYFVICFFWNGCGKDV